MRDWTLDGEDWNDKYEKKGDPTRITKKVRMWFGLALRHSFAIAAAKNGNTFWKGVTIDELLGDFIQEDDISPYILYKPSSSYSGSGFAMGGWELNMVSINARLTKLKDDLLWQRASDHDWALCKGTLEDWLRADINDEFQMLQSAGGSEKLPPELQEQLAAARQDRTTRALPTLSCSYCGAAFRQERPKIKRCATCRAYYSWLDVERWEKNGVRREYLDRTKAKLVAMGFPTKPEAPTKKQPAAGG